MKNKILKTSFLLRISLVLAVAGIILACVDIEEPDYPLSYFAPETVNNDSAQSFFLSYHALYSSYVNTGTTNGDVTVFNSTNTDEWASFLDKKANDKDLNYILYKARLGEIDTLIFSIKKPGFPIATYLKNNSIVKAASRKALDFLYYSGFAKRCEPYVTYMPDPWADDAEKAKDPRKDHLSIEKLQAGGIRQVGNASSTFVRQRYMFQVLRLYYMEGNYDKCISYYNESQKSFDSLGNSITYRAMGYAAGAYFKKKQYANANHLYAQTFQKCPLMRASAYLSFKPQEEADWNQTLAMAKTTNDKITLWELLGIYKDSYRAMKEIYALNPKSDALDLMLVRLVNEKEQDILPQGEMGALPDGTKATSLSDINAYIKNVADKENTNKPYEWNLAAGYLGWLNNEKNFDNYLTKAQKEAKDNNLVQEQIRLIRLLAKVKDGKAGDKKFENNVVDDLNWLKNSKHDTAFRGKDAYAAILKQLSTGYAKIGNRILSNCFNIDLDSATKNDNKTLNDIVSLMDKSKTPFEQFALSVLQYNKSDLVELQAVNLMYQYDFKGALAKFNEYPDAGKSPLYGDPFMANINDCHDCDAKAVGTHQITKLDFVKRMVELEDKVKANPADAADYLLLANAFYNMTYFGNNRVLYTTKATYIGDASYEWGSDYKDAKILFSQVYMSCAKAEEYYNKAMNASTDKEFKAKCCFMAAKCEQNTFFCNKPKDYKGDFRSGKYFKMMTDNYSKTEYYKDVLSECAYFNLYANN